MALSESWSLTRAIDNLDAAVLAMGHGEVTKARRFVEDAVHTLESLRSQAERGVHKNPALVVFNPPKGQRRRRNPSEDGIIASDVQAILYKHQEDGELYCHGFGNSDPDIRTHGKSVTLTGLADKTGVIAVVEEGGKVVSLRHRGGKPLAAEF